MWVNMTILGMIFVDTWLLWDGSVGSHQARRETQKDFYTYLAEELIDNNHDYLAAGNQTLPALQNDTSPGISRRTEEPTCGVGVHLTPTKRLRCHAPGKKQCYQG